MVGDLHDDRHVVLDQQHGRVVVGADRAQERGELRRFARIEPRRRLVEAEQHRIGAHGARDLQPALRAVGQFAGRIVGAVDQADLVEPVFRAARRLRPRGAGSSARRSGRARSCRSPASADCDGRRAGSRAPSCPGTGGCSGRCGRPAPCRAISWSGMRSSRKSSPFEVGGAAAAGVGRGLDRLLGHDAVAGEREAPFGRLVEAGDAVEDRRLAGAVRADQRGDVAAPDSEGKGVDRDEAAEPHGEVFDGQERAGEPLISRAPP